MTDPRWPDETTAVGPPPPLPPVPPENEPGHRIGLGMLFAIVVLAAVAAVIAAVLLTRHHHGATTQTTVVVRSTSTTTTTAAPAKVSIPVPDLVGHPWQEAAAGLRRSGLHVSLVTVEFHRDGEQTRLVLEHSGLASQQSRESHGEGNGL